MLLRSVGYCVRLFCDVVLGTLSSYLGILLGKRERENHLAGEERERERIILPGKRERERERERERIILLG